MFYAVRHFTRFRYSLPVWQSAMELRMQPRSENTQRCFSFQLSINPQAQVFSYKDHLGNLVHHFDVPGQHRQLTITADALVDVENPSPLPQSLGPGAWDELDAMIDREDYWDMLMPSRFARTSPDVEELAKALEVTERGGKEPLALLTTLNSQDQPVFFLRETQHRGQLSRGRSHPVASGRLSRFCAHHDCHRAEPANPMPVCERLPSSRSRGFRSLGRGIYPCMGGGTSAAYWLGRL